MRKELAWRVLTHYQLWRRGRVNVLEHTPLTIGEALDTALDVLDLNVKLGNVKEDRTNKTYRFKNKAKK